MKIATLYVSSWFPFEFSLNSKTINVAVFGTLPKDHKSSYQKSFRQNCFGILVRKLNNSSQVYLLSQIMGYQVSKRGIQTDTCLAKSIGVHKSGFQKLSKSSFFIDIFWQLTWQYGQSQYEKSKKVLTFTTTASKYIPKGPRICINWNPFFQTSHHKIFKNFLLSKSCFTMFTFIGTYFY